MVDGLAAWLLVCEGAVACGVNPGGPANPGWFMITKYVSGSQMLISLSLLDECDYRPCQACPKSRQCKIVNKQNK